MKQENQPMRNGIVNCSTAKKRECEVFWVPDVPRVIWDAQATSPRCCAPIYKQTNSPSLKQNFEAKWTWSHATAALATRWKQNHFGMYATGCTKFTRCTFCQGYHFGRFHCAGNRKMITKLLVSTGSAGSTQTNLFNISGRSLEGNWVKSPWLKISFFTITKEIFTSQNLMRYQRCWPQA